VQLTGFRLELIKMVVIWNVLVPPHTPVAADSGRHAASPTAPVSASSSRWAGVRVMAQETDGCGNGLCGLATLMEEMADLRAVCHVWFMYVMW
jgi:hypothetical protein